MFRWRIWGNHDKPFDFPRFPWTYSHVSIFNSSLTAYLHISGDFTSYLYATLYINTKKTKCIAATIVLCSISLRVASENHRSADLPRSNIQGGKKSLLSQLLSNLESRIRWATGRGGRVGISLKITVSITNPQWRQAFSFDESNVRFDFCFLLEESWAPRCLRRSTAPSSFRSTQLVAFCGSRDQAAVWHLPLLYYYFHTSCYC